MWDCGLMPESDPFFYGSHIFNPFTLQVVRRIEHHTACVVKTLDGKTRKSDDIFCLRLLAMLESNTQVWQEDADITVIL